MRQTITDVETLRSFVANKMGQAVAFDVETTGTDFRHDELVGLALYFDDGDACYAVVKHTMEYAPLFNNDVFLQHFITETQLADALRGLFVQPVPLLAHNMKFDMHFLERASFVFEGKLFDTLLAGQLLDENRRNGLKDLAHLVGMGYNKYQTLTHYPGFEKEEILGVPLPLVSEYAMNDVETTYKLYHKLRPQLAEENLEGVFYDLWMPLMLVLKEMEARGIALDIEKVKEVLAEYEIKEEASRRKVWQAGIDMLVQKYRVEEIPPLYLKTYATEEDLEQSYEDLNGRLVVDKDGVAVPIILYDMIGKTKAYRPRLLNFNTGSPLQMYTLVYEWSGVEIPKELELKISEKTGKYSADKDNLETLIFYNAEKCPPFLRDVLEWRKASKFITTYLRVFLKRADAEDHNSISCFFNQSVTDTGKGGTATGRLSSSAPNLLNIPARGEVGKQARSMFWARPGHRLLGGDVSQFELRILAHFSGDPLLMEAFEKDRDLHCLTASGNINMDYDEFVARLADDDPDVIKARQIGKTQNFALTYGMGPLKFKRYLLVNNQLEISLEEARKLIDSYNETYAGATAFKDEVKRRLRARGWVQTIGGRKRRLPEIFDKEGWKRKRAERQGVNCVIQGSCADIMAKIMLPVQPVLKSLGGSILIQVYDELVAEVPEENAVVAANVMQTLMMDLINPQLRCPIKAEVKIGQRWSDTK